MHTVPLTHGTWQHTGGNGVVRVVIDRVTGERYACKTIHKMPAENVSERKKAGHLDSIRREVEVLRRLAGSLNVVRLVDVFEDDGAVHLVQELCKGGELCQRISERHYSERTVRGGARCMSLWSAVLIPSGQLASYDGTGTVV